MRCTRQGCAVWVHIVDWGRRSPQPCELFLVGVWDDESLELLDVRCLDYQLSRETFEFGSSLALRLSITGREEKNSGCAHTATFDKGLLRCPLLKTDAWRTPQRTAQLEIHQLDALLALVCCRWILIVEHSLLWRVL